VTNVDSDGCDDIQLWDWNWMCEVLRIRQAIYNLLLITSSLPCFLWYQFDSSPQDLQVEGSKLCAFLWGWLRLCVLVSTCRIYAVRKDMTE